MLMKKLSEQPIEKVVEREVAAATVNDETVKELQKTLERDAQDVGQQ